MRILFLFIFCPIFVFALDVKTIVKNMTLEEKIGQLFVVPACPLREKKHKEDLCDLIKKYHIGSVIVKASDPKNQVKFLNELQSFSKKYPLFVLADAENGLAMYMSDTIVFPLNLTLGAIQEDYLLEILGKEIARQCRRVGVHINLAPVVDVNSNYKNPIIHMRSFGDDPKKVAKKARFLIKGMEKDKKILACAKHFPNHGDVEVDPHSDLPIINHNVEKFYDYDLLPFQEMAKENISCMMSAHILFSEFEKLPATLNPFLINNVMKKHCNFSGLAITDALNMKALSLYYSCEEIALFAYLAGHDLLLYGDHIDPNVDDIISKQVPLAYSRLKEAFLRGELEIDELDRKVEKILLLKNQLNLFENRFVSDENLYEDLHTKEAYQLQKKLYEKAITLIGDIPSITKGNIAYFQIDANERTHFKNELQKKNFLLTIFESNFLSKLDEINEKCDFIICPLFNINPKEKGFKISKHTVDLLNEIKANCHIPIIIVIFGTPYSLYILGDIDNVVVAYENSSLIQEVASKVILKENVAEGILPILKN